MPESTDALGEAFIGGVGYGLPAVCTLQAEAKGFESSSVLIGDICAEDLKGDAHWCRKGVWAVSLRPVAPEVQPQ